LKGIPFALLGHPADLAHANAVIGRRVPEPLLLKLLEWTPPFVMAEFELAAPSGTARGIYITCPFVPETVREQPFGCLAKVRQACRLAQQRGARLVCLGGFTSVAARPRGRSRLDGLCLPYTTGSRLTAALAVDACIEAAELVGLSLPGSTVAILGGLGEIGSRCAGLLSGRVARLFLTARRVQRRHVPEGLVGARLLADNELAAAQADIVIATAAAPGPLVSTEHLRPGAICCDVGYPVNVADSGRDDVVIFRGGLARPPQPLDFGFDIGLPHSGLTYGCFAEAMVLALEGNPALPAAELEAAFRARGFRPAGFWRGARELTSDDFARAAAARQGAREGWL
jgi:predicted amino acid dehydrogenase